MGTTSVQESAQWQLRDKGTRFLEFLSELAKSTVRPERTLPKRSDCFLSTELPTLSGSILVGPTGTRAAWLTVKAVSRPTPVPVPAELREYIEPASIRSVDGTPRLGAAFNAVLENERTLRQTSPSDRVRLDDLRKRINAITTLFAHWQRTVWEPWKTANAPREQAFRFYQRLFTIYSSLDKNPDSQELLFGHCVLTWNGANRLSYPLVLTPAHMVFKEDTGDILIERADSTRMVVDPANGTDLLGYSLLEKLQTSFNEEPVDVWNETELHALEDRIVTQLGPDATLRADMDLKATDTPVLHQGWVLFLRNRADNRDLFYRNLASKLQESEYLPMAFSTLFCDAKTLDAAMPDRPADDGTAARPLLPLPSNDEQERIVRQLAVSDEVTVQGPPGTGKSHTIVNLICHLLAQGKRVLVTAEKEQALTVLQNKIPERIRDLTIAAVGTSAADNEHLRLSVQKMQDSLSSLDMVSATQRIHRLEHDIDQARQQLADNDDCLVRLLAVEASHFETREGTRSAVEIAQWLSATADDPHIPDAVGPDVQPPLSAEEFAEFVKLGLSISEADEKTCRRNLPDPDTLPTDVELAERLKELHTLNEQIDQLSGSGLDVKATDAFSVQERQDLIQRVRQAYRQLATYSQRWEKELGEYFRCNGQRCRWIVQELPDIRERIDRCRELERSQKGHAVSVPEADPHIQLELVRQWRERLAQGKGLPRFFGGKDLRQFAASVTVDGYQPHAVEQLDAVRDCIEERQVRRMLASTIGQLFDGVPVPDIDVQNQPLPVFSDTINRVGELAQWWSQVHPLLEQRLRRFFPLVNNVCDDAEHLRRSVEALEAADARRRQLATQTWLDDLASRLNASATRYRSPLWRALYDALKNEDTADWRRHMDEFARLHSVRSSIKRRNDLYARLYSAAPKWADEILEGRDAAAARELPDHYLDMWERARAVTWLEQLIADSDITQLLKTSQSLNDGLRDDVLQLVDLSARLKLKLSQDPDDTRALNTWLSSIKRFGKGSGKHAMRYLAMARHELPRAMNAMPVWIMPLHRVLENFNPAISHPFDVIIVDESSQCGLLSVGVLALADKAIIVGDDKQTMPTDAFQKKDVVARLQDQYLYDFPDRGLFTLDESLYSLANRTGRSPIMLREHFRCVPEIIEYSNRFYDGMIFPLKERTHPQIGSPLQARYIEHAEIASQGRDAINYSEARAIAGQIQACCDDPNYDGMTFGVVTMMSGKQQDVIEEMIIRQIGAQEFAKRRIRVGNPPAFQGDERNVIFLSFITDASSSHAFRATRSWNAQWHNVAASRAQDQLWAFYSMNPAALPADDYRRGLIEYIRDNAVEDASGDPLSRTRTAFEQDIVKQLMRRGYADDIQVHHRVGRYEIDCVVSLAPGWRLAIECDGDEEDKELEDFAQDIERQRVLERLGWHFIRLSAPAYYLDQERTLTPVWRYLDEAAERLALLEETEQGAERSVDARGESVHGEVDVDEPESPGAGDPPGSDALNALGAAGSSGLNGADASVADELPGAAELHAAADDAAVDNSPTEGRFDVSPSDVVASSAPTLHSARRDEPMGGEPESDMPEPAAQSSLPASSQLPPQAPAGGGSPTTGAEEPMQRDREDAPAPQWSNTSSRHLAHDRRVARYGIDYAGSVTVAAPRDDEDAGQWLERTITDIVRVNYPINYAQLCEFILPAFNRSESEAAASRQSIRAVLDECVTHGAIRCGTDNYYYPIVFTEPFAITLGRPISNISMLEIAAVMYRVCAKNTDARRDVVYNELLHVFQFEVLTSRIERAFDQALGFLKRQHLLAERNNRVSLTPAPLVDITNPNDCFERFLSKPLVAEERGDEHHAVRSDGSSRPISRTTSLRTRRDVPQQSVQHDEESPSMALELDEPEPRAPIVHVNAHETKLNVLTADTRHSQGLPGEHYGLAYREPLALRDLPMRRDYSGISSWLRDVVFMLVATEYPICFSMVREQSYPLLKQNGIGDQRVQFRLEQAFAELGDHICRRSDGFYYPIATSRYPFKIVRHRRVGYISLAEIAVIMKVVIGRHAGCDDDFLYRTMQAIYELPELNREVVHRFQEALKILLGDGLVVSINGRLYVPSK